MKGTLRALLHLVLATSILLLLFRTGYPREETWKGVDDTVIHKFAEEQGLKPKAPLINTGQGDLLLFAFLIAGAVGGFAAGYYWKTLISGKERKESPSDNAQQKG